MSIQKTSFWSTIRPLAMGMLGGVLVMLVWPAEREQEGRMASNEMASLAEFVQRTNFSPEEKEMGYPDFGSIAGHATEGVVKVRTLESIVVPGPNQQGQDKHFFSTGSGSGVVYSEDGYIVTNQHVIKGATDIEVELADRRVFHATLIGEDDRTDLAVLKIEARGLTIVERGDSDDVGVGDWVLAIGNPFEYLTSTVTAGIVSAVGRDIDILSADQSIESFIQTDAVVNPGSSGGALLNTRGELVGINTAIATPSYTFTGYSFAIPSNLMTKIVSDIVEFGYFRRALLGVNIREVEPSEREGLGLEGTEGVRITEVHVGGAADRAGLLPGDVVVSVNGKTLHSVPQLQAHIGVLAVGELAEIQLVRGAGIRQSLTVELMHEHKHP